jgi:hypothetical protein
MRDPERIEELLALEALDALDGEDVEELGRALEEQGPEGAEWARLRRAYGDVAGRLAFALDPVVVRDDLPGDILSERQAKPMRRVSVLRASLVAGVAAVLVAAGAVGGYLFAPRQAAEVADLGRFLARADVQVFRFEGRSGSLVAAVAPQEGFLVGSDLPALPGERVYELWIVRDQTHSKGLCFEPRDGTVAAHFQADVRGSDALAVTAESASCPSQPTTKPIFLLPFRA